MWIFIDLCVFCCMSCFLGVVASRYIYVNMYRSMCSLLPGMFLGNGGLEVSVCEYL